MKDYDLDSTLFLLKVYPKSRARDKFIIRDPELRKIREMISADEQFINFLEHQPDDNRVIKGAVDICQPAFLHIVTESVFDYPSVFYTEKSIKPIMFKRPFVLLSSPGSLKNLRTMGFQTFDQWWSEDYDNIQDPVDRLVAVMNIVKSICKLSIEQVQDLCLDMQSVLEHNFNFYRDCFYDRDLQQMEQACLNNKKVRYQ